MRPVAGWPSTRLIACIRACTSPVLDSGDESISKPGVEHLVLTPCAKHQDSGTRSPTARTLRDLPAAPPRSTIVTHSSRSSAIAPTSKVVRVGAAYRRHLLETPKDNLGLLLQEHVGSMPEIMRRRREGANGSRARFVSRMLMTSLLLGWMQATSTSAFVVPAPAVSGSFCGECGNKQVRGISAGTLRIGAEALHKVWWLSPVFSVLRLNVHTAPSTSSWVCTYLRCS